MNHWDVWRCQAKLDLLLAEHAAKVGVQRFDVARMVLEKTSHSDGFLMALIEIDGLPSYKMGGFPMAMLVITRW